MLIDCIHTNGGWADLIFFFKLDLNLIYTPGKFLVQKGKMSTFMNGIEYELVI